VSICLRLPISVNDRLQNHPLTTPSYFSKGGGFALGFFEEGDSTICLRLPISVNDRLQNHPLTTPSYFSKGGGFALGFFEEGDSRRLVRALIYFFVLLFKFLVI
jgi:hypothetical protein